MRLSRLVPALRGARSTDGVELWQRRDSNEVQVCCCEAGTFAGRAVFGFKMLDFELEDLEAPEETLQFGFLLDLAVLRNILRNGHDHKGETLAVTVIEAADPTASLLPPQGFFLLLSYAGDDVGCQVSLPCAPTSHIKSELKNGVQAERSLIHLNEANEFSGLSMTKIQLPEKDKQLTLFRSDFSLEHLNNFLRNLDRARRVKLWLQPQRPLRMETYLSGTSSNYVHSVLALVISLVISRMRLRCTGTLFLPGHSA